MAGHHSTWKGDPVLCDAWPRWHELGHWLALLLAVIYLDKRTWLRIKGRLGMAPACGCEQREAALDTLGSRFAAWLGKLIKEPTNGNRP